MIDRIRSLIGLTQTSLDTNLRLSAEVEQLQRSLANTESERFRLEIGARQDEKRIAQLEQELTAEQHEVARLNAELWSLQKHCVCGAVPVRSSP